MISSSGIDSFRRRARPQRFHTQRRPHLRIGEVEGANVIAMEYVEGKGLDEKISGLKQ